MGCKHGLLMPYCPRRSPTIRWTQRLAAGGLWLLLAAAWLHGQAHAADAGRRGAKQKPLQALPAEVPAPAENPTTPEKVALGKQLFFDPRVSGDNTISCASCHLPEKAFGDGLPRARGAGDQELARNTPTLLNVAFSQRLFWDGRAKSLEELVMLPIQSPLEMNQSGDELVQELAAVDGYARQFKHVFGGRVTAETIAMALAAFQRTLISQPAPLDRYLEGDKQALSASARRGMQLFVGEADCARCHHGPMLSDGRFYRLGVSTKDDGLAAVTLKRQDRGKFRTPTLRNIAQTAPYMHDGSMATLDDVVTFYYRGVPTTAADGLPLDVQPLAGQSFSEIADLVAFLQALSGQPPEIAPPELP